VRGSVLHNVSMAGYHPPPGFGTALCTGRRRDGQRCGNVEVEGMDFCLHHMPDDMLEEAEAVTGFRRCRHDFGTPEACHFYAAAGTEPPACKNHGGNTGTGQRQGAALRVINGQADTRAAEIIALHGGDIINASPVEDPYRELMQLAGEMREWKNLLQGIVARLQIAQFRYSGKIGEQIRAEIVLYERAMERLGSMLVSIAKLNLDARLVGIRQQSLDMLDRALTLAFTKAGVPPEKMEEARDTFRQHLKMAS
jgi:hypothetical protein